MGKDRKKRKKERSNKRLLEKIIERNADDSSIAIDAKDHKRVSFSYEFVDKSKYKLSEWTSEEIDSMISKLAYYAKYTLNQFKNNRKFFDYLEKDGNMPTLPQVVPEDVQLSEIKICDKKRLVGFFDGEGIFNVIWFDKNHEVCS